MFKRIITAGIVSLLVTLVGVQVFAHRGKAATRDQVPPAVIAAFEHAYPKVAVKKYERITWHKKVWYEIEYMEGSVKHEVKYTAKGKLVGTEEAIALKDLPEAVTKAVAAKYSGAKVLRAEKETRDGVVRYEVKLQTKGKKKEVHISEKGEVIKKHHHRHW